MSEVEPLLLDRLRQVWVNHPQIVRPQEEAMRQALLTRFAPEYLSQLEGEALLLDLHGRQSRDSLAWWLEFKNDDQFQARTFGSISGGSALKFGIYQRAEDDQWVVADGTPRGRPVRVAEAITVASRQRDALLLGRERVLSLGRDPNDWRKLQDELEALAPELVGLAFFHKYLSLVRPDGIDDFHSLEYQNHHLLFMGLKPTGKLYTNGGLFVGAWRVFLDVHPPLSLYAFIRLLTVAHGPPVRWWRLWVGGRSEAEWVDMRDGGEIAMADADLGDLALLTAGQSGESAKEKLREALLQRGRAPAQVSKQINPLWSFFARLNEGDRVLAMNGHAVVGVGRVTGPYRFVADATLPHRRGVEWLSLEPFSYSGETGGSPLIPLDSSPDLITQAVHQTWGPAPPISVVPPLTGMVAQMKGELDRKGQLVLYGPPGTGKTYQARRAAEAIVARAAHNRAWDALDAPTRAALWGDGPPEAQRLWMCTFHPSFAYEEFVEGLRPKPVPGGLDFQPRPGLFRRLCMVAAQTREPCILIIDELNRGDVPRIFGELLTLLEADKRGRVFVTLPWSQAPFTIPPNVFVVGTMNTADRSIMLLDAALRRRFGFLELMPDPRLLAGPPVGGIALDRLLIGLNRRLTEALGADGRNLQVGHAYLMRDSAPLRDPAELLRVVRAELLPLLQEYCYDQPRALSAILGPELVDESGRGFRPEVRDDDDALRAALQTWLEAGD